MRTILLAFLFAVKGFRILENGANFTSDSYFLTYDQGFTHRTFDTTSPHRASSRVDPGAGRDIDTLGVSCPGMVGPFEGNKYFCSTRERGTCDRRSGTCTCRAGYAGVDCSECEPSYFSMPNNLGGDSCYPKVLCPSDCSGAGTCDWYSGTCACLPHRTGLDCSVALCSNFHSQCDVCSVSVCLHCRPGFYLSNTSVCAACTDFDPRCTDCALDRGCLQCADATLSSVTRSGFRTGDSVPLEEPSREFSQELPFGTQSSEAFSQSETYRVQSLVPSLADVAADCRYGLRNDSTLTCVPATISHRQCGHEGVFAFSHPAYRVPESHGPLLLTVLRSGGGAGAVYVRYALRHITTGTVSPHQLVPSAVLTVSLRCERRGRDCLLHVLAAAVLRRGRGLGLLRGHSARRLGG